MTCEIFFFNARHTLSKSYISATADVTTLGFIGNFSLFIIATFLPPPCMLKILCRKCLHFPFLVSAHILYVRCTVSHVSSRYNLFMILSHSSRIDKFNQTVQFFWQKFRCRLNYVCIYNISKQTIIIVFILRIKLINNILTS